MTTLTTISIMLALLLGVATVIAMRHYAIADNLRKKNKALKENVSEYREAENYTTPYYTVRRIDKPGHEFFGCWAVVRCCVVGSCDLHKTCIKVFTNEDDDFNKRKADELCEKLNER